MARFDFRQAMPSDADLLQLLSQAQARKASIDAYLAIADTATAAQVRDEVKRIDQTQKVVINALIKIIRRIR